MTMISRDCTAIWYSLYTYREQLHISTFGNWFSCELSIDNISEITSLSVTSGYYQSVWFPVFSGWSLHQGWWLLSQFSPFRYFPNFSALLKHILPTWYHVYIWQVSPQLSCGDTCQIWMGFNKSNSNFCKIENFAYGGINERSFSNPIPSSASHSTTVTYVIEVSRGWGGAVLGWISIYHLVPEIKNGTRVILAG